MITVTYSDSDSDSSSTDPYSDATFCSVDEHGNLWLFNGDSTHVVAVYRAGLWRKVV